MLAALEGHHCHPRQLARLGREGATLDELAKVGELGRTGPWEHWDRVPSVSWVDG